MLQEFDLVIRDKKGSENVVADHLSRLVNEEVTTKEAKVKDPGLLIWPTLKLQESSQRIKIGSRGRNFCMMLDFISEMIHIYLK